MVVVMTDDQLKPPWNHIGTTKNNTWKHPGTTLDEPFWNLHGTTLAKNLSGTTLERIQQKHVCHVLYVCIDA